MREESHLMIGGHRFAEILLMTGEAVGRGSGEPFCGVALETRSIGMCTLQQESCRCMIEAHGNGEVLPGGCRMTIRTGLFQRTVR